MVLSTIGRYCREQMESISAHYPYAAVSLYVIMPNHIHAIITVDRNRTEYPSVPSRRTALSVVMGGFKRAVTMYARRNGIEFGWQGRYHDHIIRGVRDGNMIAEYIKNNVDRWASDCFYK